MTDECIAINYEYIRRNENTSMLMQNIDKIDAQPTGREKPTGSAINSFVVNNGSSGVGEDVSAGYVLIMQINSNLNNFLSVMC